MAHVALLRAINVGGRNMVPMAGLRDLFAALGFPGARTVLQSGNVVFDGGKKSTAALETLLETETKKQLEVRTEYLVRTAQEWRAIISRNPFGDAAEDDPSHLVVVFLKSAPKAAGVRALRAAIRGPEIVEAVGRQAYVVYPDGIGRSKLTLPLIETKLAARGTGRNWNTVLRLAEPAGPR